jgi:SAM-dependent methyltransferase
LEAVRYDARMQVIGHAHAAAPVAVQDPRRVGVHRAVPPRDVPYVPTDEPVVAAMLRLAQVREGDLVCDLGCGDGRIVIAAAKLHGARGLGVDVDRVRIQECEERARRAGVSDRVRFLRQSLFETDLSDVSVVTLYLLPSLNRRLRPKLLWELRPGSRVISNQSEIPEWPSDDRLEAHHRVLHKWIVPAWIAGNWRCVVNDPAGRRRIQLRLRRHYQRLLGEAEVERMRLPLIDGLVRGSELSFTLGWNIRRFIATYDGRSLRGRCESPEGEAFGWCAVRE